MLSKYWTIKKIKDYLRVLVNELAPDKIQDIAFDEIIYVNLSDLCEMLNGASAPDYGISETITPSDARSNFHIWTQANDYNYSTKIVTKTGHGFTNSHIGDTILLRGTPIRGGATELIGYSEIKSIIDVDNFELTVDIFLEATTPIFYIKLGKFNSQYYDLNSLSYQVDKIIKVIANNQLCIPVGDYEFENLADNTLKQNNVFYNHFGNSIQFYKGSNVTSLSNVKIFYYRQPIRHQSDNDYIDLKDKYVNLLIAKCKNTIYEMLRIAPPEALAQYIENKTQEIRKLNVEENLLLNQTNKHNQ